MIRVQSEICDELSICFELQRHGWSDLHVFATTGAHSLRISSVFTDAFSELMDLCRAVLENSSLRIALCDEPGGHIIQVLPAPRHQHTMEFSIFEVRDPLAGFESSEAGALLMKCQLKRHHLLGMLMSELWKVHVFMSEPSYQKDRATIPHHELVELNREWDSSKLGPSFLK